MSTCLGKSCSFGLPRAPFVNCCQVMCIDISLLVFRADYRICLYQFLSIAYLLTFYSMHYILNMDRPVTTKVLTTQIDLNLLYSTYISMQSSATGSECPPFS